MGWSVICSQTFIDDLHGKVTRFHYLTDLGEEMGARARCCLAVRLPISHGWKRDRRSFTGTLSQPFCCAKVLLKIFWPPFLHGGLMDELRSRIQFDETLRRCREKSLLTDEDIIKLKKLVGMRNPLTHF